MTSVKVKLRKSKISEKIECPLFFQIIHNRSIKSITTSYRLFPWEWSESESKILISNEKNERNEKLLNISHFLNQHEACFSNAIDLLKKKGEFEVQDIVDIYNRITNTGSLFSYMMKKIDELFSFGRYSTAMNYKSTLHVFSSFMNGIDIQIDKISGNLIQKFELFLKCKGLTLNTISFYMRILRSVYNKALSEGVFNKNEFPFKAVYTGIDKTNKRAINDVVMNKIKEFNLTKWPELSFTRDMFLFSFYTRGMAFVDIAYLKKSTINNGVIKYYRHKTGQLLYVKVVKQLLEIINKYSNLNNDSPYILPILKLNSDSMKDYCSALRLQNKRLKKISVLMNLQTPLTTYTARHSWASIAKNKGIPIGIISEGMGHDSIKTTSIYLSSLDRSLIDNANEIVIAI